jgi:putative transposase
VLWKEVQYLWRKRSTDASEVLTKMREEWERELPEFKMSASCQSCGHQYGERLLPRQLYMTFSDRGCSVEAVIARSKRTRKLHHMIHIGVAIHNHAIVLHKRYYRLYRKHLSLYQLKAHITKLKQLPKYAWWKQLGSQAIQDIIIRIDKGYQRFFQMTLERCALPDLKDRKAGKTTQKIRPPTFRKLAKAKSFTLTQAGWKLLGGNQLRIGTTVYKFAKSRDIAGTIKTVTIKRHALGELYVYFSCVVEATPPVRTMTGKSAGFDFGLSTYLTGSDGSTFQAPQPFKQGLRAIAQANRALARKAKGSNHQRQAHRHLCRVHRRVASVRRAFHWALAHDLCATYDAISLETLNLQGMKVLWGRKVSDLGFATFVDVLHHVADKTGVVVTHVGSWFPSTKLCSGCGHVNPHISLRDRLWTCTHCGATHLRDQNAATNIDREGASSRGEGHVRPTLSAVAVDPRIP